MNTSLKIKTDLINELFKGAEALEEKAARLQAVYDRARNDPSLGEASFRSGRVCTFVEGVEVWCDPVEGVDLWTTRGVRIAGPKAKNKKPLIKLFEEVSRTLRIQAHQNRREAIALQSEN